MRRYGSLTTLPGAGSSDHVCWVHDDDAGDDPGLDAAVRTFLAGGLALGERLLCVGDRVIESVREDPSIDVDALVAAGTLELLTEADAYSSEEFSAEHQLAYFDAATRRAVADGCTGLRVVAEVSALAADPRRRRELVRWEQMADRFVVQGPGMTAMCIYGSDLPADALADLASVHPVTRCPDGMPQFRAFFDDDHVVIAGCVDASEADRLARVLADLPTVPAARLDLSHLEFVDVAGCRVIADWAADLRARGVDVDVRGASRLFRRVWRVLALDDVAPVAFAEVDV